MRRMARKVARKRTPEIVLPIKARKILKRLRLLRFFEVITRYTFIGEFFEDLFRDAVMDEVALSTNPSPSPETPGP